MDSPTGAGVRSSLSLPRLLARQFQKTSSGWAESATARRSSSAAAAAAAHLSESPEP